MERIRAHERGSDDSHWLHVSKVVVDKTENPNKQKVYNNLQNSSTVSTVATTCLGSATSTAVLPRAGS